jgi:hypothetical protein
MISLSAIKSVRFEPQAIAPREQPGHTSWQANFRAKRKLRSCTISGAEQSGQKIWTTLMRPCSVRDQHDRNDRSRRPPSLAKIAIGKTPFSWSRRGRGTGSPETYKPSRPASTCHTPSIATASMAGTEHTGADDGGALILLPGV